MKFPLKMWANSTVNQPENLILFFLFNPKFHNSLEQVIFKKSVNFLQQNNYNSDSIPGYNAHHLLV